MIDKDGRPYFTNKNLADLIFFVLKNEIPCPNGEFLWKDFFSRYKIEIKLLLDNGLIRRGVDFYEVTEKGFDYYAEFLEQAQVVKYLLYLLLYSDFPKVLTVAWKNYFIHKKCLEEFYCEWQIELTEKGRFFLIGRVNQNNLTSFLVDIDNKGFGEDLLITEPGTDVLWTMSFLAELIDIKLSLTETGLDFIKRFLNNQGKNSKEIIYKLGSEISANIEAINSLIQQTV
ncbi:hypothetical protein JXB31_02845, partial [Candidatus Woesearchaeota archaeon]|nr:hypothetical protein [Candidatus Woesearchaeota archaeon]